MTMFRQDRLTLIEIADTGTTKKVWLARDLIAMGLVLPACHDRGPHTCHRGVCDGWWKWVLTTAGRDALPEVRADETPAMTQMELFT